MLVKQADLSSKIRSLKAEIKKLESITDICPTCGQKLPNVTKIDTTEKHSELDQLTAELSDVDKQVSESNAQLQENLDSEVKKFDEKKFLIRDLLYRTMYKIKHHTTLKK